MPPLRAHALPAANRIFVDREQPQKVFEEAAFTIPADRSIVRVFYGIGGQGKTALCRELWRKTDPAAEPSYSFLRRAELDLHGRQNGQGDFAGARPLIERAVAIREKVLGPEHPDTAVSLSNLAILLQAQGDLAGARPLYERALASRSGKRPPLGPLATPA